MLAHRSKASRDILIILTDQLRHDAVGYTNPIVKTPNLNHLAEHSVNCSLTYTQSPQCQPSRASIFTGRYPTAHKVWWNGINLPLSERTIAHHLPGYHCAYFGKSHFSGDDKPTINKRGFEHSFLYENWIDLAKTNGYRDEYLNCMTHPYWTGRLSNRRWHHEDIITDKTIDWLQTKLTPKLTVISYVGPHPPYAAPPPFDTMYSFDNDQPLNAYNGQYRLTTNDWKDLKSQYYGMITWIDDNIGKLLAYVNDDTIIIFTSDHGDILGDHNQFSKGLYMYEGNTRVPLLIKAYDLDPYVYAYPVQSIDILPTVLSLLGKQVPYQIQGRSLLRGLKHKHPVNNYVLSMIGYTDRIRMIRDNRYKYWIGQNEFLFDMIDDNGEQRNIIENSTIRTRMTTLMLRALIAAEDKLPVPRN